MVAFAILLLPLALLATAIMFAVNEGRGAPYGFAIGRVISNAFGIVGGAPLVLLAASFTANAPFSLRPVMTPSGLWNDGVPLGSGGFAYLLIALILQLFAIRVAVDILEGRSPAIAAVHHEARMAREGSGDRDLASVFA